MKSVLKLLTGIFGVSFAIFRRRVAPCHPPEPVREPLPITAVDSIALCHVPEHWPPHYNVNMEPCDMTDGPCCCGAWHDHGEDWVRNGVARFGVRPTV